jgi:hypothetical protein
MVWRSKDVAIAVMLDDAEETTADEVLDDSRSMKSSDSDAIAKFLAEFLKGRGWVGTGEIKLACLEESSRWNWGLIKKVWVRRHLGESRQEGKRYSWRITSQLSLVNGHDTRAESSQVAPAKAEDKGSTIPLIKDLGKVM